MITIKHWNRKTAIAILKFILCCYKANSSTTKLLNHLVRKMCLLTLHICCALCSFGYLKSKLDSKSRLPISELSGSHYT